MSRKNKIRRIVAACTSDPWMITPSKLNEIRSLLELRSSGVEFTEAEIQARIGGAPRERQESAYQLVGSDAIIPLMGVLAPKMNLMAQISGGTSTQQFSSAVVQADRDPKVKRIVFDVDSPGGTAMGNAEAAQIVRDATKPTIAVATGQMCSAAYFVASAADQIVASPSSSVGSIGTRGMHVDQSEADKKAGLKFTPIFAGTHKVDGSEHEPLTKQSKATMQEQVNALNDQFEQAVSVNRGVSVETVKAKFGQGKHFLAAEALSRGMIDRIATLDQIVNEQTRPVSAGLTQETRSESVMDPKIMTALIQKGLITANDTGDTAQAVLKTWYSAQSKSQPESIDAVVSDLVAKQDVKPEPPVIEPPVVATRSAFLPPIDPKQTAEEIKATELAAVVTERSRVANIQAVGRGLNVADDVIQTAISSDTSLDTFRELAEQGESKRNLPVGKIEAGQASADKFSEGAVDVLLMACGFGGEGEPIAHAASLQGASMLDIAEESFAVQGHRVGRVDNDTLASAALGDQSAMREMGIMSVGGSFDGPGSFPQILSNLARKSLDKSPPTVGTTYQFWTHRRQSVPDFKPQTLVRLGTFGEFPHHPDGTDFQQSTFDTERSWIKVESFGDEFAMTPQMMVDDDMNAFSEAMRDKRAVHGRTLNTLCLNLLTGNQTAADGNALFDSSNHGNDITSGADPDSAQLAAMRLLLRRQTEVGGRKLNQTVQNLLIPEALETETELLLSPQVRVTPTTTATGELWRGRVGYWVEPQLTDSSSVIWYAFGTVAETRPIVYTHQKGFENMKTRNYFNPKNNSRIFQFESRMAAAINTWRGVVRNAGE